MSSIFDTSTCISTLLHQEAAALAMCSPTKGEVKVPTGSTSNLTRQGKEGKGPGHCIVKQWPPDKLPVAWGERNRAVLLDEMIQPEIWSQLHHSIAVRAAFTRFVTPLRSNDNGNEEAYRGIVGKIFERVTAIAFLFFLNQWLKPENKDHPDLSKALETLQHFEVQYEHTCAYSKDCIRCDNVIQIGRHAPFPILKVLQGTSTLVTMSMGNVKSIGNAEHEYDSAFSSPTTGKIVASVDQCLDHLVSFATSQPTQGASVKELRTFLSGETSLQWPHIAVSHLAQMSYELDLCASSCGVFSAIWGFHRVGLLKYPAVGDKILYVSQNLAAGRMDRVGPVSNQGVIEDFFFLITSSILLTYGETIVPPNLRNENFLSYFRG